MGQVRFWYTDLTLGPSQFLPSNKLKFIAFMPLLSQGTMLASKLLYSNANGHADDSAVKAAFVIGLTSAMHGLTRMRVGNLESGYKKRKNNTQQ